MAKSAEVMCPIPAPRCVARARDRKAAPAAASPASLATLFALAHGARGTDAERAAGIAAKAPAPEMTK